MATARSRSAEPVAPSRCTSREEAVRRHFDGDTCNHGEPLSADVRTALVEVILRMPPEVCDWILGTNIVAEGSVRDGTPQAIGGLAFAFYRRSPFRCGLLDKNQAKDWGYNGVVIVGAALANLPHEKQVAAIADGLAYALEDCGYQTSTIGDGIGDQARTDEEDGYEDEDENEDGDNKE